MTQVPPVAPPAAAPPPPPPNQAHNDLAAAANAAQDRIDQASGGGAAYPDGNTDGQATPPPAGAEAPFDIFAEGALEKLPFDQLGYRDGKKLETEIRRARETFRPLNDAFGALSDEARANLLQVAPELGDDLVLLGQVGAGLHPEDRQFFTDTMQLMASDPQRAAEQLARGAEIIRQSYAQQAAGGAPPPPGGQPMPEWAQGNGQPQGEGATAPLTEADFQRLYEENRQKDDYAHEVKRQEEEILRQAKELGYAPNSKDPVDDGRFAELIHLAGRPEIKGDLAKAHEIIQESDQRRIDAFVAAKAADAGRPGAPAVVGGSPAQPRALETLQDAADAARDRIAAVMGPDRNRRSED